jgi:hypothetical protein
MSAKYSEETARALYKPAADDVNQRLPVCLVLLIHSVAFSPVFWLVVTRGAV